MPGLEPSRSVTGNKQSATGELALPYSIMNPVSTANRFGPVRQHAYSRVWHSD